jgi:hypothetical protein
MVGDAPLEGLQSAAVVRSSSWDAYSAAVGHKFFALLDPETRKPLHVFRHTPIGKRYPVQPFQASATA